MAYNNNFSNILRLARGAHLSHEVADEDHDGKEPLPGYLKKTTITFANTTLWRQQDSIDPGDEPVSLHIPERQGAQNEPGLDSESEAQRQPMIEAHATDALLQRLSTVSSPVISPTGVPRSASVSAQNSISVSTTPENPRGTSAPRVNSQDLEPQDMASREYH